MGVVRPARTLPGACAGSRHAHPSTARRGGHGADGGLRLMQQAFIEHGRVATREVLTAQERQVARLAKEGLSSPDIGARLFRSPRTAEWHLRNAFIKLGIHSRRELTDVLLSSGSELVTA